MKPTVLLVCCLSLMPYDAAAETPQARGLAIAIEADRRDSGYRDIIAKLTMVLRNRQGQESIRQLRRRTLEVTDDADKSLDIFDQPRDVKGTAILTYAHALEPDEQWIYLPELKRVKRISTANKSGPFMGSEFSYEDIADQAVDKYTYVYLRDEVVDGHDCFVSELTPAYRHSGYTRQIEWLDKEMYQPRKVVYYDRQNTLLKTLTFEDYRQYMDRYWRPNEMLMENNQTGKTTRLIWTHYRFNTGLTDEDFNRNSLRRVR